MKKTAIFSLCLLLVLVLAGCGQGLSTTAAELTTAGQASTAPSTQQTTVPDTTAAEIEPPAPLSDEALIAALTNYIQNMYADDCEMPDHTLGSWLLFVEEGSTAYFAVTDEDAYYYMCAYFDCTHEYEDPHFCCVEDYTWVKFSSEAEISEYYGELQFVIGFQVNGMRQSRCLSTGTDATMEYCQRYKPVFADGFNTAVPLECDNCFLYRTNSATPIYYIHDWYIHRFWAYSCTELDGQFYIVEELSFQRPDGTTQEWDTQSLFLKYRDEIMEAMGSERYSETHSNGYVYLCGRIKLEDLEQIIRKIGG